MKNNPLYLSLFLMIAISGCTGGEQTPVTNEEDKIIEDLRAEVMEVHDEVMPLTADIERYVSNWEENPGNIPDSIIKPLLRELKAADEAMWDWMHEFNTPSDSMSFESKKTYYQSEQERIDRVAVIMKQAVEKAEQIKNEYQ